MNQPSKEEKIALYNARVINEIFGMPNKAEEDKLEWSKDMFEEPHEVE